MRGRKPKPTDAKRRAGNPGRRPLNDDEPEPAKVMPEAPAHFSSDERAVWDRLAPELFDEGLFTKIDGDALALYCCAEIRYVAAKASILKFGEFMVDASGEKMIKNPNGLIVNQQTKIMKDILIEFGKTPSSRSRVKVKKGEKPTAKGKGRFFNTGKVVGDIRG